MQRKFTADSNITAEELNEMDARRIDMLDEAGISEKDVLGQARDDLNTWQTFFNENMTQGKDDMNFCIRDQWSAIERSEFNRLFMVPMTFNKLYDAVKKVAGEQRKNKPDLIVRSLTGHASQEQINLRADLVRTISYQSQNDLVYQTAFKSALLRGWGAFQIDLDYETPFSFNQIVKYLVVNDPTRCYWDPTAEKPHKGDGNFCARTYIYTKEQFAATYPYILNPDSYTDPRTLLDFQWETRNTIVVADYFVKEWFSTFAYKLSNGMHVSKEKWEEMQAQIKMQKDLAKGSTVVGKLIMDEIPKIIGERQTEDYRVRRYRLIKDRIIDFTEWPSRYLPIIFVDGDSSFIESKQYTKSFIHEARDAQKFVNYVGSAVATEIKNRRKEQWMGTPDNIIGQEQQWRNPETQMGILIARPDPKTGQMPQKMPPWELAQGLLLQYQRGNQDINEILGFHQANQGAPSNEKSGVAVEQRQLAGSMSSYVFQDNMNQAVEQGGRVVLDLLPVIYGQDERPIVIARQDGKTKPFILNERMPNGEVKNRLDAGDYDIEIDTGPSFAVQKAAALQLFLGLIQANPQIFPLVADLVAKNLDLQFMSQISERFETLVPPQILAKERGEPPPPQQPDPQQQALMMQQQLMQQEMQLKEQKMQIEQQALQDRAEELRIRMEAHELDKAKLILDAKKMENEMDVAKAKGLHENHKADLQFSAHIARVLADLHKDQNKPKHTER